MATDSDCDRHQYLAARLSGLGGASHDRGKGRPRLARCPAFNRAYSTARSARWENGSGSRQVSKVLSYLVDQVGSVGLARLVPEPGLGIGSPCRHPAGMPELTADKRSGCRRISLALQCLVLTCRREVRPLEQYSYVMGRFERGDTKGVVSFRSLEEWGSFCNP